MLRQDLAFTADEYTRPLDDVSQFAHISRPVVAVQSFDCAGAQGYTGTEPRQKRLGEFFDISQALA